MMCSAVKRRTIAPGFTLVELLVVIVVIAVLATLTVASYNGVSARAASGVLKSDLRQASSQLGMTRVDTGSYPQTSDVSSGSYILKHSPHTVFEYTSDGTTFHLTASSSDAKASYHIDSTDENTILDGADTAAGHIGYVAPSTPTGVVGTWAATAGFASALSYGTGLYDFDIATYNGYLYILGGGECSQQVYCNTVLYAKINANGTVGNWAVLANRLPDTLGAGAAVAYNGYLYYLGGKDITDSPAPSISTVYYAKLNSDGTTGAWATTTQLPAVVTMESAVAYNGYIYILGGATSVRYGPVLNTVRYAPINANGTIGSWSTTTSLSGVRYGHSAVVDNGHIYVLGGYSGSTYYNDVQYATINANGTIGSWTTTSAFNTARYYQSAAIYNGYLYILGGANGTTYYNDVQYSPINANGTIGAWKTTTSFNTPRYSLRAVPYNGYLYLMGGSSAGGYVNDVQYAGLN